MSSDRAALKTINQKLWIAVRFIVFGIVGFWVMLGFMGEFALRVFWHHQHTVSPFLSFPLAFVGAVMMLYGVGEWGRWAYLWVFLSIPITFSLCLLVPGAGNSEDPVILAGIAAFFTCTCVKVYYSCGVRTEPTPDGSNS